MEGKLTGPLFCGQRVLWSSHGDFNVVLHPRLQRRQLLPREALSSPDLLVDVIGGRRLRFADGPGVDEVTGGLRVRGLGPGDVDGRGRGVTDEDLAVWHPD